MGLKFQQVRATDRIHIGDDVIIEITSGGNGKNLGMHIIAPKNVQILKEEQINRPLPRGSMRNYPSSS